MTVVDVSTTVDVPPREAYEFVLDFEGHSSYSEYVDDVVRRGDGGVGTRFDVELAWWKLSYTFPTEVTDLTAGEHIDWRTPNGLHAKGAWLFEPTDAAADGGDSEDPDESHEETRVTLRARYDRRQSRLPPMPPLVSVDDVLDRLKPVVRREARTVFEHAVADLEGERRRVTLDVDVHP